MKIIWEFNSALEERRTYLSSFTYSSYCVQTIAGKEIELATELNIINKDILALPFIRITHKSINGKKSTFQKVLLPGYVFLFLPQDKEPLTIVSGSISYRFVRNMDNNDIILHGGDRRYSEWVFNNGGIIGMSKAIRVNGRVKVISGPLYNMIGNIKEYSKKNRNCRIELILFNRLISMWLPFEWVTEIPDDTKMPEITEEESNYLVH